MFDKVCVSFWTTFTTVFLENACFHQMTKIKTRSSRVLGNLMNNIYIRSILMDDGIPLGINRWLSQKHENGCIYIYMVDELPLLLTLRVHKEGLIPFICEFNEDNRTENDNSRQNFI